MEQKTYYLIVNEFVDKYKKDGKHTEETHVLIGILMDFWTDKLEYEINRNDRRY